MRLFQPCNNASCDFQMQGKLAEHRWYPTTQLLADGRVLVVGVKQADRNQRMGEKHTFTGVLTPTQLVASSMCPSWRDTLPYNLYPIIHLLPNGQVFMSAGNKYVLFDTAKNEVVPGNYPDLQSVNENGVVVQHLYPLTGTSAMFPLHPLRNWEPEVMICGGPAQGLGRGRGIRTLGVTTGASGILPLSANPQWVEEAMRLPRVLPLSALLPDGSLFIHGGAQEGFAGIPNEAHKAVLTPELYDTFNKKWRTGDMGVSRIPRVYHASAVLIHDGTVFLSGSNPHQDGIQVMGDDYPTSFRTGF